MKKLIAFGLVLISALPMAAQSLVTVQSGEHDGFTRIVLATDPGQDWQVVESYGKATLQFPGQKLDFSTATVFDRISTARIAAVQGNSGENGSAFTLELNCGCEVKGFAFADNYIVLDVFDGPELGPEPVAQNEPLWRPDALPYIQPPARQERFLAFVMTQAPVQPVLLPDPPPRAAPVAPEAPDGLAMLSEPALPDAVAFAASVIEDKMEEVGAVVSEMNTEIVVQDDPELLARIEDAQNQLLAQLTRAADQGLVDFALAPVEKVEEVVVDTVEEVPPATMPEIDSVLMQQLSARTAYAQNNEDALAEIVNQFAMPQCLGDAVFSMESWGDGRAFSDQLSALRSGLLGEFDTPDAEVAEKLIQLYLRFGLGAEARLILSEMQEQPEYASIYNDMADLLEGEPERVNGQILQGVGCGGAHEMWYLATGRGNYQVFEPLAISEVFSNYPIEVRTIIGPALAQAFIERGQVDAGHVVLEIVRRADGEVSSEQLLAEASVLEAQSNIDGAQRIYRNMINSNDERAPEAMIALARGLLNDGRSLPESLLVDIESAAFFNRETSLADPLRLWEIRVRAEVEGADKALAQIAESIEERPDLLAELQQLAAGIFEVSSAAQLGDYQYAQMVLRYASLLDQGEKGDLARLKIAKEMAGIGLPESALDVLTPNLTRPQTATTQLVAAAYVQLFEPEQALDLLIGDSSLEAYKIKLDAYLQMEDYAAVAQMLAQDFAAEVSLNEVALRAGDWEKIRQAGAVGTLAAYMNNETPDAIGETPSAPEDGFLAPVGMQEEPSLKAVRELLAINQASRSFLEDVIAAGE